MACRVRYLNSSGIHLREIPGIEALSAAYPENWLLYASLQCYQQYEEPFDVDVMVVMDDRVLLLEIKDWKGTIVANGDNWLINDRSLRSPISAVTEKARKLGTFLRGRINGFGQTRVHGRVVLTGGAPKPKLDPDQQSLVWTLDEAKLIAQPGRRSNFLEKITLGLKKPYDLEREFDRITGNRRMFGPSERKWDGYKVVEEDYVSHPRKIWREHRAELSRDARRKALLRIWAFDELTPAFNSPEQRRMIIDREDQIFGYLAARGSDLVRQGRILRPIGANEDDILTDHYELRELPAEWTTLDRWLERTRETLDDEDRRNTVAYLLNIVAELHDVDIEHRDLGPRSIWIMSPTQIALSGFMTARVPGDPSLKELHQALRGYAPLDPPEPIDAVEGTGKRRDVFLLGRLAFDIINSRPTAEVAEPESMAAVPIHGWLTTAMAQVPEQRFADARSMADEFGVIIDNAAAGNVDRSVFERFKTNDIPYVKWQVTDYIYTDQIHQIYVSRGLDGTDRIVKIWMSVLLGQNTKIDTALAGLCYAASRLETSPIVGIPPIDQIGISPVGIFTVEHFISGTPMMSGPILDASAALKASETLVSTVSSLHAIGLQHGRIEPSRILLGPDGEACLLGSFELPSIDSTSPFPKVGDLSERLPLSVEQRDRRAVVAACLSLIESVAEKRFDELVEVLRKELERPVIEILEPSVLAIKKAATVLHGLNRPRFLISDSDVDPEFFRSDDGNYYLRVERLKSGALGYKLAGVNKELIFEVIEGRLDGVSVEKATFKKLSHASQHGVPIAIDIDFRVGEPSGLQELFSYLVPLAEIPDEESRPDAASLRYFDVRRFWRRHLELEQETHPEVEILRRIGSDGGPTHYYGYERIGRDWDADTDTKVEVITANRRKNGELDLGQTDSRTLAIRFAKKPLLPGDKVSLVEQRSRTSLDRRTRAVERILEDEAAINGLIDYFSPQHDAITTDYGVEVDDDSLQSYGLNPGQAAAFRHLARFGPIGLLQGPPGSGKTRFIAAFVHWLITKRGARRILITSQSHEAVNNVIEALVDLFKAMGRRPNLLRIGSKGITDKIRPYHVDSVRERYRARFDAAFRHRVQGLCGAMGIKRAFVAEAVEIDRRMGAPARHLALLARAEASTQREAKRSRKNKGAFSKTAAAFAKAGYDFLGREAKPENAALDVELAFENLTARYPGTSLADVRNVRAAIELSHEWSSSLSTSHRNFEEFLGKTREIVTATCVGAGQTKIRLDAGQFDWVVVDEAARCTAGELAVPIQAGRRVLLVGDHRQLLPMVQREVVDTLKKEMPEASQADLIRSDFERSFLSSYGQSNGRTLTEQYRMTPAICELVSKIFYEPYGVVLKTSDKREGNQIFKVNMPTCLSQPIAWIDTGRRDKFTEDRPDWSSTTFWNDAETDAVMNILENIAETTSLVAGLSAEDVETPIGVICMYSAQKISIEQAFSQRPWEPAFRRLVRIDTVDSYQGKENTIVIVSLVRDNPQRDPGHVRIANRCNVALSRAKERLFIVGAYDMWSQQKTGQPMKQVIDHVAGDEVGAQVLKASQL